MKSVSGSARGSPTDLADSFTWVRAESFERLFAAIAVLLWLSVLPFLTRVEEFWPGWGVPMAMLAVAVGAFSLRARSFRLACGLFTANLLLGPASFLMARGEQVLTPFLFVPAVLVAGTLLGSRAAFVAAGAASAVILLARPLAGAIVPTSTGLGALALLWLTALTSWATTRSLYTALHWAWSNSEQSERNLAEARDYQGRLAAALRQLEEANYRLERANYALTWARAEADQARRLKAQFAAHVSHELRTPINLVVGFTDLMLNNPETYGGEALPRTYLADLTALHRSAKHLQGLIDDILDLSQIDAGEMPVLRDLTEVGAIVHEAVATAKPLLDRKGLSIRVEVEPGLPLLSLDRLRIRQVLLNLLNNAARFTERGGVTVRAFRDDGLVVVEVADTGVGIRPQHLGKLFQPFHQLDDSPTRSRGGTGLGLAISKRFVELHGGRIWARSEGVPGKGSVFGFALPVEPADEPPAPGPDGDHARRWKLPSAPPAPTVVVLDDDPSVVGLFQRHLDGYQIVGAAGEAEAVELAARLRVHAVVTDVPAGDCLTEWHSVWARRAAESCTPVLACPMPSGRRVARALGLVDYIVKPVTKEALLASVEAVAPEAKTILVVDDDAQMVRLLCRMLRTGSRRYQLLRAYDGKEALAVMRQTTPDLVLLDLLMPQVDGLTVLERMRSQPALASVPVVAVSARGVVEAIFPSSARTLTLVSDVALPVSRMLRAVRTILDSLPPSGADEWSSGPEPRAGRAASGASG